MGDILLREDLEKILDWLIGDLSHQEIKRLAVRDARTESPWEWLKKHLNGEVSRQEWMKRFGFNKMKLSLLIQEILDLRKGRIKYFHSYAGGLPKEHLLQLANEELILKIPEDKNKAYLRQKILQRTQ